MFRQVVGTIFSLMEYYAEDWKNNDERREVEFYGEIPDEEPKEIEIDHAALIEYFRLGYTNFSTLWKEHIDEASFAVITALALQEGEKPFRLPTENWVRIVYRYAILFHNTERQRFKILDTMIPLYYARVASLVQTLSEKSSREAEAFYEEQAQAFERDKQLLVENWNNEEKSPESGSLKEYLARIWR